MSEPDGRAPEKRPDQPELVQSGTFLVDRGRALRRLRDYQFEDPKAFLLPWVRCAVLSGATGIDAQVAGEGLVLSFDGTPLDPRHFRNPYAALFEDDPDGERYRHIAVGLLAALRLQPKIVTVASGSGGERHRLSVFSLEEPETFAPFFDQESRTEIALSWPESVMAVVGLSPGAANSDGALARLKAACGMLRVPLRIAGKKVPGAAEGDYPAVSFEEDGVRSVLVAREFGKPKEVMLYRQGVRVMSKPHDSELSFVAHVDDERFRLDASHGKVIEDEAVEGSDGRAVARHVDELLLKVCEEQTRRASSQSRDALTVSGLTGLSLAVRARLALRGAVSITGAEKLAAIEKESWLANWLRSAARTRLDRNMLEYFESLSPALKALWNVPVYVSVTGKPLSLRDLGFQWKRIHRVPYSNPQIRYPDPWVFGFEPTVHIVWLMDEGDPCLHTLFRGNVREWGALDTAWELTKLAARKVAGR